MRRFNAKGGVVLSRYSSGLYDHRSIPGRDSVPPSLLYCGTFPDPSGWDVKLTTSMECRGQEWWNYTSILPDVLMVW
jgi:hypothetical protein